MKQYGMFLLFVLTSFLLLPFFIGFNLAAAWESDAIADWLLVVALTGAYVYAAVTLVKVRMADKKRGGKDD